MKTLVHHTPVAAEFRLRELGLTRDGVISAVRAAMAAVAGCTGDSPPIAPGWLTWYNAVVRLRQEFRGKGWDADDTANFSTIVDHAAGIKIAVANTDEATACVVSEPTNRSRRGELSKQAVAANQLSLPFDGWLEPDEAKVPGFVTWYLCIYIAEDTVRAELSLPTTCEGGYFGGWKERIFLISSDDDWITETGPDARDGGPEFEVFVTRK